MAKANLPAGRQGGRFCQRARSFVIANSPDPFALPKQPPNHSLNLKDFCGLKVMNPL